MSSLVVNVSELTGAIAQAAGALRTINTNPSGLDAADAWVGYASNALTVIGKVADGLKATGAAHYLGAAGMAANIVAYEIAKNQMAAAEASGDQNAYNAAVLGAISAAAGAVAALPLGPQVKLGATAVSIIAAAIKEYVANGATIQDAAALAWDDAADALGMKANELANDFLDFWLPDGLRPVDRGVSDFFGQARTQRQRDPLVLDLDGDGIETIGTGGSGTVLFDHDGDGTKTGTGWVKGDDGFLVLDRNGNGSIDNGGELFGVDTTLANGSKARDGFGALKDLDSNGDGVFSSADAKFADVRVWRDLNQDGISQAGELISLTDTGIASINLTPTEVNKLLPGGNTQTAAGTFTRTNGQQGLVGDAAITGVGNLNLADNPFYREFADSVPLTDATRDLPNMQGSGAVRDLREAATLNDALAGRRADLQSTPTRQNLQNSLDAIILDWGKSSGFRSSWLRWQAAPRILRRLNR